MFVVLHINRVIIKFIWKKASHLKDMCAISKHCLLEITDFCHRHDLIEHIPNIQNFSFYSLHRNGLIYILNLIRLILVIFDYSFWTFTDQNNSDETGIKKVK